MSNNISSVKTEQAKNIDGIDKKLYGATLRNSYASSNPKVSDYKKDTGKESCFACQRSGQPCLEHIKTDKKIVDITDLFGETTSEGLKSAPEEKNKLYSLVIAAYIKDVADQLPQGFANTKAVLEGIAAHYLKQAGASYQAAVYNNKDGCAKTASGTYSTPESPSAYSGKSSSYNKN